MAKEVKRGVYIVHPRPESEKHDQSGRGGSSPRKRRVQVVAEDRLFKRPFPSLWQPEPDRARRFVRFNLFSEAAAVCWALTPPPKITAFRTSFAGYTLSPGHFHRSRNPSDAADSSDPECWVA